MWSLGALGSRLIEKSDSTALRVKLEYYIEPFVIFLASKSSQKYGTTPSIANVSVKALTSNIIFFFTKGFMQAENLLSWNDVTLVVVSLH